MEQQLSFLTLTVHWVLDFQNIWKQYAYLFLQGDVYIYVKSSFCLAANCI